MADPHFLDEFIAEQTDSFRRRLAEIYRDIVRTAVGGTVDHPARLRQTMDAIFAEHADAATRTDRP